MFIFLLLAEATQTSVLPMPSFLAGCWEERRTDGGWTEECWTSNRGGLMIGSGRDGRNDNVGHWEWMRIERDGGATPIFYGSPKGTPAVAFKAIEANATSITFVNSGHDYPQRVRYLMTGDRLAAEVSLADGTKPSRWRYRRSSGNADR